MTRNVNVITAGPSAGKSSTIRELSARGYRTLPEAARIVLDQRISEGDDPEKVRQEDDFHEQVERIDRKIERQIPNSEPVFLDRSLLDNVAYRRHFNNNDCKNYEMLLDECENYYDNIFILERIDFQDDAVRSEDEQEAQEIHSLIVDSYEMLGYSPVHIPVKPVDERVDMILNNI